MSLARILMVAVFVTSAMAVRPAAAQPQPTPGPTTVVLVNLDNLEFMPLGPLTPLRALVGPAPSTPGKNQ